MQSHGNNGLDGGHFRLVPLLFLTAIIFINFCARMMLSPLLVTLEHEFSISHAAAGRLFLYATAAYSVMMLFSGFISAKVSHRGAIIISIFAASTGVFLASRSQTLELLKLGLVLTGAGGGMYAPSGLATITTLADQRHWGKAFSVHEIGPVMGFVSAPFIAEIGLALGTWRTAFLLMSVAGWIVGLIFILFGRFGDMKGEPPSWSNIKAVLNVREFRILSVFFILMLGLELGVYSMLPTFLIVVRGMERETVNFLVGASRLSGLGVMFLSGILVDKIGEKLLLGWICTIAGILTVLMGFTAGPFLLVVVFLQPITVAAFFPASLTALSKLMPPRMRNVSTSILIPAGYLFGAGIAPAFLGLLADLGFFAWGFVILGGAMVAGLPLLRRFNVSRKMTAATD